MEKTREWKLQVDIYKDVTGKRFMYKPPSPNNLNVQIGDRFELPTAFSSVKPNTVLHITVKSSRNLPALPAFVACTLTAVLFYSGAPVYFLRSGELRLKSSILYMGEPCA